MLASSKVVFSVGSSVGIEATRLGVKSVYFVGRNYFEDLNAFKHIRSLIQLKNAIVSNEETQNTDVELFGAYISSRKVQKIDAVKVLAKQTIMLPSGEVVKTPKIAKAYMKLWNLGLRYLGPKFMSLLK